MYRRHSSDLLERNHLSEDNTSDGTKTVKMSFCRRHDVELKEKLLDKIIPNDIESRNNWLGNGNSGMDAVAQAIPNVYTQLSTCYSKQLRKRECKFEHSSNRLHGMIESVQLIPTGILHTKIKAEEFADELSLMETRMSSLKARTTASSKIGPCLGPAALWEEVMMKRDSFGK